jgi:1,4-alpha-glucan branching enzyme
MKIPTMFLLPGAIPLLASCAPPPIAPKLVGVTVSLDTPGAQDIYLCGDFNPWSPVLLRMFPQGSSGCWEQRLTLAPGRYQYKFVVDGEGVHDPEAFENVHDPCGSLSSVMEVHP